MVLPHTTMMTKILTKLITRMRTKVVLIPAGSQPSTVTPLTALTVAEKMALQIIPQTRTMVMGMTVLTVALVPLCTLAMLPVRRGTLRVRLPMAKLLIF